jgi:hypothetical protein
MTLEPRESRRAAALPEPERCVVCDQVSDELMCAACRALLRGESDPWPAHTQPL